MTMTDDEILSEFRAADALLEGHFILSSGLRSGKYLQCARVLMDGARAERLARAGWLTVHVPSATVAWQHVDRPDPTAPRRYLADRAPRPVRRLLRPSVRS